MRTETTINNTYDFQVGRRLKNLPRLRHIGFGANRRVLEVEKVSHDSQVGAKVFEKMQKPLEVDGQHASALRFGDPGVQALLSVLLLFALQPAGVRNRQLRPLSCAVSWGCSEQDSSPEATWLTGGRLRRQRRSPWAQAGNIRSAPRGVLSALLFAVFA